MGIEWPKTMVIQDGLDNTMGAFPMSLSDEARPPRVIGESISLYDIEHRLWEIETRMQQRFWKIELELTRIQDRIYRPWYGRLWDWTRKGGIDLWRHITLLSRWVRGRPRS